MNGVIARSLHFYDFRLIRDQFDIQIRQLYFLER